MSVYLSLESNLFVISPWETSTNYFTPAAVHWKRPADSNEHITAVIVHQRAC